MAKSKNEKNRVDEQLTVLHEQLTENEGEENSTIQEFTNSTIVLMPELEELVKKKSKSFNWLWRIIFQKLKEAYVKK
ncbi:MAG: hypothetical protein U0T69_14420 [Chitinophagales bacterium]